MREIYNMYCDESCHLLNDGNNIMVLGGVWCPLDKSKKINQRIREIKKMHGINHEMKWVKISSAKKQAYIDLINYFFDNDDLHFRVLVVDNKNQLNHEKYNQTHDEWYYKIYFDMIKTILIPVDKYNIYLDIKDSRSKRKTNKLREVLSNNMYDFSHHRVINKIQVIRSDEVEIMQIVDILIGAMAYHARNLNQVDAKNEIIQLIKTRTNYQLSKNTLYAENKFNIFHLRLTEDTQYE